MLIAMLLAIDVGNTQTHIGMFRGDELVEHWRLATVRDSTGDELATLLVSLLELRDLRLRDVDAAILSSVVPQLTPEYERLSERYLPGTLTVVGPGMKTGMAIRTERPQELGTDRLVNAVAAYDKCGGACIVADFGTTINFDAVSKQGELLGAAIAPGVDISLEALHQRTAKLPKVDLGAPEAAIGRDTVSAVRSGVVYGFAGSVDGIVGRIREELGDEATAIATGGLASVITPFCDQIDEVDDLLTLTGLRLIWDRNQG
jgi:type III pantothenate kinase